MSSILNLNIFGGTGDEVNSLVVQPDGKIVVAGAYGLPFIKRAAIARLNSDLSFDTSFPVNRNVFGSTRDNINAVVLQPDGKIVVGGVHLAGATDLNAAVARFNTDGSFDTSFGASGLMLNVFGGTFDQIHNIVVGLDGSVIVGGEYGNFLAATNFAAVAKLTDVGGLDTSFGVGGVNRNVYGSTTFFEDTAYAFAVQTDGKILVGGFYTDTDSAAVARLTTSGAVDPTFGASGLMLNVFGGIDDVANSIAVQGDGKIVVGGDYTPDGINFYAAVGRLTTTGLLDTTFATSGLNLNVFGGTADGIQSVGIQPDGKIVLGGFYYDGTNQRSALTRFKSNGLSDTDFPTTLNSFGGGNDNVFSLVSLSNSSAVYGGTYSPVVNTRQAAVGSFTIVLQPTVYSGGITNTFGGFPLYDPREVRTNRARFRRDMLGPLERANSIYCPSGRWASRGWLLMARSDYDRLNRYSTDLQLVIGQDRLPPIQNLSIVQAQCATRGLQSDPNALYLVEVTDDRGILLNQWFQFPLTSFYNVRSPAYGQAFYPATTSGGTPWTWSGILQDVWNQMVAAVSGALGMWTGLPFAPLGVPEGFWFPGVGAWSAFNDVLEFLGMTLVCDLTQPANPFTIVTAGAPDPLFAAAQARYLSNLEDDLEWIDQGAGRVPAYVMVLFRRRNQSYGTEETVRPDYPYQWALQPFYPVRVNAPPAFAGAVGAHYLWSDFTVEYDENSVPLPGDVVAANSIATERVAQYYNKIFRSGYMTRTYAGALPFVTGSQCDGVRWYQDYSSQERQGWKTELVRGAYPPWPELWDTGVY